MFKLIALTLCAITAVRGIVIPHAHRDLSTYDSADLEPYTDYSARYQELNCASQHNTQFFTDCCHPMLKGQTLQADRKPYCIPASSSASASATAPTATEDPEDSSSSAPASAATSAIPAPVNAAAPPPSAPASPTVAVSAPAPTNSGKATWFYQHGTAGACGTVHQDTDKVIALDSAIYGGGKFCGKTVQLINVATGATTQATVADECPTCESADSIDLSQGAFNALTGSNLGLGEFDIAWFFTN